MFAVERTGSREEAAINLYEPNSNVSEAPRWFQGGLSAPFDAIRGGGPVGARKLLEQLVVGDVRDTYRQRSGVAFNQEEQYD